MTLANSQSRQLADLYAEMAPHNLTPLWETMAQLVKPVPSSPAVTHFWSFDEARKFLLRAGDLISAEKAERRVLILENPGLAGMSAITPSVYAGLQLILPGEIAPAHRHSQSALRFVMEGSGAFTAVNGEKAIMHPFDLVLTPSWEWHDHGNPSGEPMIWLDGLDIPTVRLFDATFAEHLDEKVHPETAAPGASIATYGHNMRPMGGHSADYRPKDQPLFHYPHSVWRPALDAMAGHAAIDPHIGHALEFINPADGGAIMNTISAHVRFLPAGFETRARRSTDGTVFVVVEGNGTAVVGEREFNLGERDTFVVPSWNELRLQAKSDLVLFGFSDQVAQQKLGLFKELCS
ncbi:gentisate 1,2-dioxygenase [Croceicoccus marinus]|uniref:Gentisate 1,2-dioxygenase n=1 Tax=Croceicoccus marinus TaxID=450378 RepID=A0A1Z1F8F5_9SPHN|nr:gentisate 1,2-dioxygenase [Croceicoccus marinus]ARU15022.1 gentisate 1,2-dioxygenase [Croceicoccus marinus]